MNMDMTATLGLFAIEGEPAAMARYGSGHINETYKVDTSVGRAYILQKINDTIFKDVPGLMRSIAAVTAHLRGREADPRRVLAVVPAKDGLPYARDGAGGYWRVYDYVAGSLSIDAGTADDMRESGAAFGRFRRGLADFDASVLTETIPRFHDTPHRYEQLDAAVTYDRAGRLAGVSKEVGFALSRRAYAGTLTRAFGRGDLPLRVTHNDTKLNNVLFDEATREALCVIDLDTVMPGLSVNDFGDAIRFGANTAAEDETDLDKVSLSLPLFEAFARGYMASAALTPAEAAYLRDGAKTMTLECGVRFLTDYLNGDVYFRTARPTHNLDRCRTQFRLLEDMARKEDEMEKIIAGAAIGPPVPPMAMKRSGGASISDGAVFG